MISPKRFLLSVLGAPAILLGLSGCAFTAPPLIQVLPAIALGSVKVLFLCIPEGTPIDTPSGPRPIESIRPGDEVIGFSGATVRVKQTQGYQEDPTSNRFRSIEFENGAEVSLCDMHRIDGVRAKKLSPGDEIGGQTVKSIEVFKGVERSYDLLTEDAGYRISGIPVNSMIEEMYEAGRNGVESIPE